MISGQSDTCYVGIDLGGTNAKGAAYTQGGIGPLARVATGIGSDPGKVINDLAGLVLQLAGNATIAALGVGVPGLVDPGRGESVFSPNLRWRNVPIAEELSQRLKVPVYIDNDVRAGALGELSHGKARGCRDFVYLAIGTGIGSGVYIDGRLLQGPKWSAGEVGHMILWPEGPVCSCGTRGCLEALASASAIAREARKALASCPESILMEWSGGEIERIDALQVALADQAGDTLATRVMDNALRWLGIGVANLVNIFNPELVVLGGGVSMMGERMLRAVENQVSSLAMPVQRQYVRIALSSLGDRAGVLGALELALNGERRRSDAG
jgi:glucokinase